MIGSAEILSAIRELTNSKQIDRTELHGLLQDGIHAALAKKHGPTVQAEVEIDERNGKINIVLLKTVVDEVTDPGREISVDEARFEDPEFQPGDVMEIPVDFAEFGRSAVQAAKQRIIQRVREGERSKIRDEFTNRVGELLSGEVQQIERGKLVVMLNKFREAEAIIPYREQNHREHFHQGDPIRAAAREVGSRTKIAVFSKDDSIDPVGACVGLKGSRVQAVVNELNGERIDIVPWSSDPERFAKLALAPARVARVQSDSATRTIQAIVDEDQLSLAIGRNGQNVRLASELTGWKIDLYSSREWMERSDSPVFAPLPEETDIADVRLSEIEGMPLATVAVLEEAGFRTLNDIIDLERDDFLKLPGIAPEEADRIMSILDELTEEGEDDATSGDPSENGQGG